MLKISFAVSLRQAGYHRGYGLDFCFDRCMLSKLMISPLEITALQDDFIFPQREEFCERILEAYEPQNNSG
jgi:hypothetical protein